MSPCVLCIPRRQPATTDVLYTNEIYMKVQLLFHGQLHAYTYKIDDGRIASGTYIHTYVHIMGVLFLLSCQTSSPVPLLGGRGVRTCVFGVVLRSAPLLISCGSQRVKHE